MKELERELSGHLIQASLQGERGPTELPSKGQRHSWGLEEENQVLEVRHQHGWPQLGRSRTHSRQRSGSRQHQSPSPSCSSQWQFPSSNPPWNCPVDEWLHCSLETLELQPKSQESKDRAQWHNTSLLKEEKPRKHVHFKADKELGEELDLPSDLAHFLVGDAAPEQWNTSSLAAGLSTPTKGPQHTPPLAGGAQPKVQAVASSSWFYSWSKAGLGRERPDPVRYPCHWIAEEISQPSNPHSHCWEEIRASGKLKALCMRNMMIILPNTMPYGRWQPLGSQWHNKRSLAGGTPHLPAPPTLWGLHSQDFPLPLTPRISRSSNKKRHWL